MPVDVPATMRALGACRNAMIDVHRSVRPMGPAHHAAAMVISATDAFAVFLTGERYYFSAIAAPMMPFGVYHPPSTTPAKGEEPCP